ncbi:MAG: hypothetical protein WC799_19515 [Desulfobacteraceae bacterium]
MKQKGVGFRKEWMIIALILVLASCSMNRLPNSAALDQISLEQSRQSSLSPKDALALAEKDIDSAKKEALEYYAPIHLSQAEQSLKKAQSLLVKGTDPVAVIAETIKVRKMVAEGISTKQTVLRQMSEIFEQKQRLDKLKADVLMRDDYDDQLDNIKELILVIEKGEQESFEKKKKEYLGEMLALEIEVVKKKTLSEAIQVLQSAKKIDAKKLAPKTWKIAEDTLKQSTEFIQSYPRDEEGVKKAGLDALRASQHVFFVTKETFVLKETDKDNFENVVLDMESKLDRIALGLNHPDVRHMSLYDQSVTLGTAAEAMNRNVVVSGKKETPKPLSSEKEIIGITPPIISEPVSVVSETPANNEDPVVSADNTPKLSDEPAKVPEEENVPVKTDTAPEASQSVSDIPQTKAPEKDIESIKNELEEIEKKL